MKTALLSIAIVLLFAGAASLLCALFFFKGYYGLLDGSKEQYASLRRKMTVFFLAGILLIVSGALCILLRVILF